MFRARVAILTLLVASFTPALLGAQTPGSVPRVVRFDGIAPAGAAGARSAVLAVFDAPTGGSALWEETQIVQVDATGRYSVLLGAGQADGLPPAALASSEPRWLEVRFEGGVTSARALLTSVPYALRASDADTLGGLPASAFLRAAAPGREGAASAGASSATVSATTPLVNTGTTGFIGKFANTIDLTSSAMFDSGGRIGIGTTSPLDTVHARFSDNTGTVTGYAVQNLGSGPASYSGMLFYDQNGNLGQFQGFNNSTHEYRINNIASGGTINFMLGGSRFFVGSAGIGINNTSPQDALDVSNGFVRSSSGFRVFSPNTSLYAGMTTALDNLVLNWGLNDGQAGTNVQGTHGGFLRIDLRGGGELAWWHKEAGTGVETRQFAITQTGILQVPSLRTTALSSGTLAVYTDVNGNTGFLASSRRFKEDIEDMGDSSNALMRLRPVTYHYKRDVGGLTSEAPRALEYGLIAEEVAEVYPDAVATTPSGEVQTVQYNKINAMLLNEVQKQYRRIEELTERLAALEKLLTSAPK